MLSEAEAKKYAQVGSVGGLRWSVEVMTRKGKESVPTMQAARHGPLALGRAARGTGQRGPSCGGHSGGLGLAMVWVLGGLGKGWAGEVLGAEMLGDGGELSDDCADEALKGTSFGQVL